MFSSSSILTVDLAAIQANWRYVASSLKNNAECAAVVKADAYSVGAEEVAKALYLAGCRSFYLATVEEAVVLRMILPADAILYVLGGVRLGAEPSFAELRLIPVLYSLAEIKHWSEFCASICAALPCVIKVDTGMTRLGLRLSDLDEFLQMAANHFSLNPILIMSHLACADEPGHPLNTRQLQQFEKAVAKTKVFFPQIKTSLANSSATFLGEEFHFDMVRIGAALYGINPQRDRPNPLQPAITLKLSVLQIRLLETDVSVGYGAAASAKAGTRLAVVAGGYADGIHRTLGLSPRGMVNGQMVPAVGRISMDSCVFDISAVAADPEYIEVMNEQISLDSLIAHNNFLGYEVLTSLGRRYLRRYLGKV
ncbi:MAG TPA: alanine racemase [Cellvibrio sp.]|nr:alanine racemase [Cellvibrio sp.]